MSKLLHGTTHREKWWGTLGSFAGILATLMFGLWIGGSELAVPIVASMGASAVLLFAAPHSPLAQPWNTFGGHMLSGLVGVLVAKALVDVVPLPIAASAAVCLAILVMQYFGCIHPPGGATALFAVMGGPKVLAMGFSYLWLPLGLNTVVLLASAILFGRMSRVPRYPARSAAVAAPPSPAPRPAIDHEDLVHALGKLDTFIDVDERDLLEIYRLATGHHADAEVAGRLRRKAAG